MTSGDIKLFLCGDVMIGRGVDQILPFPVDPVLYEPVVRDARRYVELAETVHGPVPRPAALDYVWGDALGELSEAEPDARLVNLETSVTGGGAPWPEKEVCYRVSPANAACLVVAGIDVCSLANNHVLDWGYEGLEETLRALDALGVGRAGAGRDLAEARAPATVDVPGRGRLLIFALGLCTSGIPRAWAAAAGRPGVFVLDRPGAGADYEIGDLVELVRAHKRPGDLAVASIHWGSNWGFEVPAAQRNLARALVSDAGIDVVHGHSSHHIKGIEVFRGRPILYGCGDLLTDYEGISGYERYRDDLGLMYFVSVDVERGELSSLQMTPTRVMRLQITRAGGADAAWIRRTLEEHGAPLGTSVSVGEDGRFDLHWR